MENRIQVAFCSKTNNHFDGQKQDKKYQGYSKSHAAVSYDTLTLFYTGGFGSLTTQVFPLLFNTSMVIFNHTIVLFQMGEGCAAIQMGGGLPSVGGGGSLMTQSAGSFTPQNIVFKYVMASEPYRFTCYLYR